MTYLAVCPACHRDLPRPLPPAGSACPFCRNTIAPRPSGRQFLIVDGEGFGFHRTSPYAEKRNDGTGTMTRIKNKAAWRDHLKSGGGRYEDAR